MVSGYGNRRVYSPLRNDRIFQAVVFAIVTVLALAVLYPLVYILSASFSSTQAVLSGKVVLWPVEPTLDGYGAVFRDPQIFSGYGNTVFYTVAGTMLNVSLTMMAAYPLSRRDCPARSLCMFAFTFTMLFSGGMIPNYMLMNTLGLINTRWAILLPNAIVAYNLIIARFFIENSIPEELLEAAHLDGCSDIQYFFVILLPLCKAVIAVITLYYAVSHWNAYFNAFLYLSKREYFPLQIILRDILVSNQIDPSMIIDPEEQRMRQGMAELLKYALIVVSTAPILCLYPFVQRYFISGVTIGAVKG